MTFGIELRDLRYFETIAELEHIGRASKRLHRTQPALSGCLRRLEDLCGAPLFEKAGRGIRLTEAGRILLKWARRVRLDIDDAKQEFDTYGRGLIGHVRLGLVPTAAQFLLPEAARHLIKEAPDVSLRTVVALVDALMPLLRAGEIDLMIGTERPTEDEFVSNVVGEDVVVVAASTNHPIFRRRPPRLTDLAGYRWALQPPGAPTRDWLDNAFERHHLTHPNVQVESTMLLALPALIAETGLLSFVSRQQLGKGTGTRLREVPVRELNMTRRMVLTYRENAFLSPACRRLIALLLSTPNKVG